MRLHTLFVSKLGTAEAQRQQRREGGIVRIVVVVVVVIIESFVIEMLLPASQHATQVLARANDCLPAGSMTMTAIELVWGDR